MDTKYWLDSTTVRGALLAVSPAIVSLLKAFGIELGDADMQTIVEAIAGLAGAVGVVMAIVGRFKAQRQLSLK